MGQKLIDIGCVTAPHGVKGEFRVNPLTDFPNRFLDMKTLCLYDKKSVLKAELVIETVRIRPDKGDVLIKASGIDGRDQADSLKGLFIKIPKDQRVELEENEYWIDDLIGLKVLEAESGQETGVICGVLSAGGCDVYSVKSQNGKVFMIPAVSKYVLSVDLEAGVVTVQSIRELMDL